MSENYVQVMLDGKVKELKQEIKIRDTKLHQLQESYENLYDHN